MDIKMIRGKSGYIKGGTNTGTFTFNDNSVLIIDPGLSSARGNRISEMLREKSLYVNHCIVTHEHLDHFESYNSIKQNNPNCKFYCSRNSKIFFENPLLFTTYIYGAKPHHKLLGSTKKSVFDFKIDNVLEQGKIEINKEEFIVYDLRGHSNGDIGILTPDRVLYVGDALFDYHIMKKYDLPFLFDVEGFMISLNKIINIDFDRCIIGHSKSEYIKSEILEIVKKNEENTKKYLLEIETSLTIPLTREEILKMIINKYKMNLDYKEYHYYYSTIGSMLSMLINHDIIQFKIEEGLVYYLKN